MALKNLNYLGQGRRTIVSVAVAVIFRIYFNLDRPETEKTGESGG
jgi:hypothetical protein